MLKEIIKENKSYILIVMIAAPIAYTLLSLFSPPFRFSGMVLSSILGVILYITLELMEGKMVDKNE